MVPPGPWIPRRSASHHMVTPRGAVPPGPWSPRRSASHTCCKISCIHLMCRVCIERVCNMYLAFLKSRFRECSWVLTPPCLYLWGGGVLLHVIRVGSSPKSIPEFRNSGFSTRASVVLASCSTRCVVVQRPLLCPRRAVNSAPAINNLPDRAHCWQLVHHRHHHRHHHVSPSQPSSVHSGSRPHHVFRFHPRAKLSLDGCYLCRCRRYHWLTFLC